MKTVRINPVLITVMFFATVFCFPLTVVAQDTVVSLKHTTDYLRAKQEINALRENSALYFGEGTAKIGNDIGKAKMVVKKRALEDLSSKIKIRVQSAIQQVVSSSSVTNNKMESESVNRKFEDKINTYTDKVLRDVETSQLYINYPDSGYVTIAAYLKKSIYKQRVEDDLKTKKTVIHTTLSNGSNQYARYHYLQAVSDWIKAANQLHDFFNGIPVIDKIGENGSAQDLSSYINGRITLFFSGLYLKNISGKMRYNAKGRLNKEPLIVARYKDENGQEHSVARLPLKVDFIQGNGIVSSDNATGTYGQAKLFITHINPANRSTLLRITVDTTRIAGLNNFTNLIVPKLDVTLLKVHTLAMAVLFRNGANLSSPQELKNIIQSAIINQGLAAEQISISKTVLTPQDIQQIGQTHADDFLFVNIKVLHSSTVGGYKNMFVAECTATVSVYQLPLGNLITIKQLQNVKGYGASASSAGWDAYNQLKSKIISATQNILEGIR